MANELQYLGYDELCLCHYNSYGHLKGKIIGSIDGDYLSKDKWDDSLPAPTYDQVLQWFRYLKEPIEIEPSVYFDFDTALYKSEIIILENGELEIISMIYETYEEAREACIQKLIQTLKNKTL